MQETNTDPLMPATPTMQTQTVPQPVVVSEPNITQPIATPKKGKNLKLIGCIVIIFILLLTCGIGLIVAIPYLKNNFIPGISPITENITSSPSEQIASRIDPYLKMGAQAIDLYAKEPENFLNKLDYKGMPASSNTQATEYELSMNMINNDTTDNIHTRDSSSSPLDTLTNAKNITFTVKGEGKSNYKSSTDQQSEQTMNISIKSDGITVEGSMDLMTNNDTIYTKINSIPDLGIGNMEGIVGKWYSITPTDLSDTIDNLDTSKSDTNNEEITKIKNLILGSKELFYKPTLEKNIKSAGEESYHGITLKCYSLTLNKGGVTSLVADINSIIKDEKDKLTLTEKDMDGFAELYMKICFDKNSVGINKVEMTVSGTMDNSEISYGFKVGNYDMGKKVDIIKPTDSTDIKDLMNELFGSTIEEIDWNEEEDSDLRLNVTPELEYSPDMGY